MDEQSQSNPPTRYTWPRYVLAGVILGIVLAIFWMAVLVHRVSEQREDMQWPTNTAQPVSPQPTQAATNSPLATNSPPPH